MSERERSLVLVEEKRAAGAVGYRATALSCFSIAGSHELLQPLPIAVSRPPGAVRPSARGSRNVTPEMARPPPWRTGRSSHRNPQCFQADRRKRLSAVEGSPRQRLWGGSSPAVRSLGKWRSIMTDTSENEAARDERDDNVLKLPPKDEAWNPFDVEALKALGRGDEAAVEKVILKIEVRKPGKGEFFRTHPDPEMSVTTKLYKSDDGETFLVNPAVSDVFGRQIVRVTLYYCVNRYGDPFLWPVRVPEDGEKDNSYWQTARLAADKAIEAWNSASERIRLRRTTPSRRPAAFSRSHVGRICPCARCSSSPSGTRP